MCGGGPVVEMQQRGLLRQTANSASCPDCDATFLSQDRGRLELAHCRPDRIAQIRKLDGPTGCRHCHPCFLGSLLSKGEWERLAEMEWPLAELSAISGRPSAVSPPCPSLAIEVEVEEGE